MINNYYTEIQNQLNKKYRKGRNTKNIIINYYYYPNTIFSYVGKITNIY